MLHLDIVSSVLMTRPDLWIGKVLSKPTSYGLESEQGRLAPFDEICPYNIGDMVFIRVCDRHIWYQ
jgi:hypothetical protein